MPGFVYLWRDKKHKRFYIGSHWGSPDDRYICSSSWMRRSYERRPHDFKRRILETVTASRKDLLVAEQRWLAMIRPEEIKRRYYNLRVTHVNPWFAHEDSLLSVGQKISRALTGKRWTEERKRRLKRGPPSLETRAKMSAASRGRKRNKKGPTPDHVKEKIRAALVGKQVSDETREKLRLAGLGKAKSPELAAKIAATLKGRRLSEEHKANIARGGLGRVISQETIVRRRATFKANRANGLQSTMMFIP